MFATFNFKTQALWVTKKNHKGSHSDVMESI